MSYLTKVDKIAEGISERTQYSSKHIKGALLFLLNQYGERFLKRSVRIEYEKSKCLEHECTKEHFEAGNIWNVIFETKLLFKRDIGLFKRYTKHSADSIVCSPTKFFKKLIKEYNGEVLNADVVKKLIKKYTNKEVLKVNKIDPFVM